jgi:SAM domain (Sterile alpha motif)/SPOR domain
MDVGGWLRSLGLEQYETAFQANAVNADVLRDLTDHDLKKLGVLLGHRPKLLRAIAALDSALGPASAPRDTPLPIPHEAILAAAAKRATHARQQRQDHSVSSSPLPFPMPNRLRSAEIDDRFLPSLEAPRLLLAASDDRDDDNIQTAETGEAHGADDYYDGLPSPRWRHHLVTVIAVIAVLGLGAVGAFAYRAVLVGAVLPAPPPIVKAEDASNENVPTDGDNRPSDLSRTSTASAGSSDKWLRDLSQTTVGSGDSSKEFVSRWSADIPEPPNTAAISSDLNSSPRSAAGSAVAPIAIAPDGSPPSIAPPALAATSTPRVPAPVRAPRSSAPKKVKTALAVGGPLSLAPDAHVHSAASPPSRPRKPAGAGTTAEVSAGGGYVVAVASERSVADADAVFRSLQAKFPSQLGGREPIMRRTELGPEGTYYKASIGPFVSRKAAAGVCSSLKAAGESCLVEKN